MVLDYNEGGVASAKKNPTFNSITKIIKKVNSIY